MYTRARVADLLEDGKIGARVRIQGWVRTRRDSKGVSFVEVKDGSCLKNLQGVVDPSAFPKALLSRVTTGASVALEGTLVASPGRGQRVELDVARLEVIGDCDARTYPLQKKGHSFEFLRSISHLRPRTNALGAVFRVRSAASAAVHRFFLDRGFYLIHTPVITSSDCEGAGEMFQVTTFDLANVPVVEGRVDFDKDFFGKQAGLTVSGQLQAETAACALSNVYTFGPTFRAENSNTARHLAEFWMVEPEMAFCDLDGCIDLAVAFLKEVIAAVLERCADDIAFLDRWVEKGLLKSLEHVRDETFARVTYTEAIDLLRASKRRFEFPVAWGADLQAEHERYLTETYWKKPVVVTDYPASLKPFYMRRNDDGKTVAAMDLLVPRIGEIVGGSQREERVGVLEAAMVERGMDVEAYRWYLDLRRFGTVPHAGFGVGFERLIMFLTGMQNIRDVILYPRAPRTLEL